MCRGFVWPDYTAVQGRVMFCNPQKSVNGLKITNLFIDTLFQSGQHRASFDRLFEYFPVCLPAIAS